MDSADRITDILHQLKSIRDREGDPIRVKKPPSAAALQAHVEEFNMEKRGSFRVDDAAVVDEARRLAAQPKNFFLVLYEGRYELYTMR